MVRLGRAGADRLHRAMLVRLDRTPNPTFAARVKRIDKFAGPAKRKSVNGSGTDINTA